MSQIRILKPKLPNVDQVFKYYKEIDDSRWYTNFGPLTAQLETRLAQHFDLDCINITTVCSGTEALILAARVLVDSSVTGKKKKYCLVPGWTFVATGSAMIAAGLTPILVDVCKKTWAITPELCHLAINQNKIDATDVGLVVPVAPFGCPIDLCQWDQFSALTNIKVIVDAAASFDSLPMIMNSSMNSRIPIMISLHATKVFGVGEGAILVSRDSNFILKIKKYSNFGFWGSRNSTLPGINAKVSEYVSAVGLAELDGWSEKRARWYLATLRYLKYQKDLEKYGINYIFGYGQGWISSYCNISFANSTDKERVKNELLANDVEVRDWWGEGLHKQDGISPLTLFKNLQNTELLSNSTIGLPFYTDIAEADVDFVVATIIKGLING